ncbi:MAG: peptide-methionine (S)-S-oxide reductase MsrA [Bacteroidetes bacterium]|nr:peptide-methionine (S)-S-oxide reductase MsrA [Bacteroidota bacterium]
MNSIRWLIIFALSLLLINVSSQLFSQNKNKKEHDMNTIVATFGSGCFWCSEAIFNRLDGVIKVEPGFSGGKTKNPSYKDVVTGTTGHAEVSQITYNPDIVSFSTLLEVFWKTHDPTTLNRQGADVGTQYRSVIFFHDENQETLAREYLTALELANIWENPIVTEIVPFVKFYPAEEYHNDYYENNPANSYCSFVITPKIEKFKKVFADKLKKE